VGVINMGDETKFSNFFKLLLRIEIIFTELTDDVILHLKYKHSENINDLTCVCYKNKGASGQGRNLINTKSYGTSASS
jgi:hypothetical protein